MARTRMIATLAGLALLAGVLHAPAASALPLITQISIDDVVADEGDEGITPFEFTVSLNLPDPLLEVQVDWSTQDSGAVSTGPFADYAAASGTLVFAPGETEKTITVEVLGDTHHEFNDTFPVRLTNPVNAEIARGTGTGWIMNDDPVPALSIDDVEAAPGDEAAVFTVSLDRLSARVTSVWYETVDGTAVAGEHYTARSGWLVMEQWTGSGTVTVPVAGAGDGDRTFSVRLSSPFPATIERAEGTATLLGEAAGPPGPPGQGTGPGKGVGGPPDGRGPR